MNLFEDIYRFEFPVFYVPRYTCRVQRTTSDIHLCFLTCMKKNLLLLTDGGQVIQPMNFWDFSCVRLPYHCKRIEIRDRSLDFSGILWI